MKLRSIQLQGFKTFGSRTRLNFSSGLTAIVGPNGSGKSNLADAVAWVLGEQALSALRVKRSSEIIHQPTDGEASPNMVDVQISVEDKDGFLPLEGSDFDINRVGFRDGESEYRLNGHRTRLNQIREIFAPFGMAGRSFSLIRQGHCDQYLSVNAIQRRRIVEEAAGALGLIQKKMSAVRRLTRISDHLGPVYQELRDLKLSLSHLERQARQFERRKQLIETLGTAVAKFYIPTVKKVSTELDRNAKELKDIRNQQEVAEASYQEQRFAASKLQCELEILDKRLKADQGSLSQAKKQFADLRERQKVLEERGRNLNVFRAQSQERQKAAVQSLFNSSSRLKHYRHNISQIEPKIRNAQQDLEELATKAKEFQESKEKHQKALTQITLELEQLAVSRSSLKGELSILQWQDSQEESNAQYRLEELREAETGRQQLADTLTEELAEIQRCTLEKENLIAQQADLKNASGKVQRKLQELQDLASHLSGQQSRCLARQDYLTEISRQGAAAFEELPGMDKSLGQLATLLYVEPANQAGVSACLGDWQYSYVFRNWAEALDVWEAAQKQEVASDLRLAVLQDIPETTPSDLADKRLLSAAQAVKVSKEIRRLIGYMLANSALARGDCESVATYSSISSGKLSFLATKRGDLIAKPGLVKIRGSGKGQEGLLNVAFEVQGLEAKRKEISSQLIEVLNQTENATAKVATAEGEGKRLRDTLQEVNLELQSKRQSATQIQRELQSLSKVIDRCEHSRQRASKDGLGRRNRLVEIEKILCGLGPTISELTRELEEHNGALQQLEKNSHTGKFAELRDRKNSLTQEIRSVRMLEAQEVERSQDLRNSVRQIRSETGELDNDRNKVQEELGTIANDLTIGATQIECLNEKLIPLILAKQRLDETKGAQAEAFAKEREVHLGLDSRRLHIELQHSELTEHHNRLQRTLLQDLELLTDKAATDLDASAFLKSFEVSNAEALNRESELELDYLRRQIHRCGQVDPNLYISYRSAQERRQLLESQTADMAEAEVELRRITERLDTELETITHVAFAQINDSFGTYFERFFPGGKGWLSLQQEVNESEAGIELHVQLEGQQPQSVAALSGGERAMAAIAFLFSLLNYNRPPFCVLDEIDAALDDSNVGYVGSTLQELKQHTQFILITHNQQMLEYADSIFGVTKNSVGTSQLLSMKLPSSRLS